MDLKTLLLSFDGRIGRKTYWMCYLGFIGVMIVLSIVMAVLGDVGFIILMIFSLAVIWPALAIQAKRWHDRDKSAWWILMNLLPVIGPIWVFVEAGCLQGTSGDNRFGPDPLASSAAAKPATAPSPVRKGD